MAEVRQVAGFNSSLEHGRVLTSLRSLITSGYASTATDEAVQANMVAAGYSK